MKYCQGPKCHTYRTKDRIRGAKGGKYYATRRRSSFYYLNDNACSLNCANDWFREYGTRAIDHFGRIVEPKKTECDNAWYKSYNWDRQDSDRTVYNHYFVNDLLGERRPITEEQYDDDNLVRP